MYCLALRGTHAKQGVPPHRLAGGALGPDAGEADGRTEKGRWHHASDHWDWRRIWDSMMRRAWPAGAKGVTTT